MTDEKAWREFDEDISMILENTLKGTSKRKKFGIVEPLQQRPASTPSRRQKEISRLRKELRSLGHLWKRARLEKNGLAELREQARNAAEEEKQERAVKKVLLRQSAPFHKEALQE